MARIRKFRFLIVCMIFEFAVLCVVGYGTFFYEKGETVEIRQLRTQEVYFDVYPYYRDMDVNNYVIEEMRGGNLEMIVDIYNKKVRNREITVLIVTRALEFKIPMNLLFALIDIECAFDENAKSSKGALGLMQLMPKYFKHRKIEELLDIYINTMEGCAYLQYRCKKYGSWYHAAYYYYGVDKYTLDYLVKVIVKEKEYDRLFNEDVRKTLFQKGYRN